MRTTIELHDELFREAKMRAVAQGTTLRALVEQALRTYLQGRPMPGPYRLRWGPAQGKLRSDVDVDDRNRLHEIMEERE